MTRDSRTIVLKTRIVAVFWTSSLATASWSQSASLCVIYKDSSNVTHLSRVQCSLMELNRLFLLVSRNRLFKTSLRRPLWYPDASASNITLDSMWHVIYRTGTSSSYHPCTHCFHRTLILTSFIVDFMITWCTLQCTQWTTYFVPSLFSPLWIYSVQWELKRPQMTTTTMSYSQLFNKSFTWTTMNSDCMLGIDYI